MMNTFLEVGAAMHHSLLLRVHYRLYALSTSWPFKEPGSNQKVSPQGQEPLKAKRRLYDLWVATYLAGGL